MGEAGAVGHTAGASPPSADALAAPQNAPPAKDDGGLVEKAPAYRRWEAMDRVARRTFRYLVFGAQAEPVPSHLGLVEQPQDDKLGICCSGGGIRSAAFNLGALQWLQEKGQLQKASYLAAVSGGSYIAAAMSMVAKTWPSTAQRRPDADEEGHDDSDPDAFSTLAPFDRGSPEEQYLRNHCSYLAPDDTGLTYIAFRALLGLAFNLVFVSLPLFAAGLLLGEYAYRPHLPHLVGRCASRAGGCKADVGWWWTLPVGALALGALLALVGMLRRTHDDSGRLLVTWSTRLLFLAVLLALLLVATPALVDLFRPDSVNITATSSGAPSGVGVIGGGAGLAGLVLGVLSQLRQALASPKNAYEDVQKGRQWWNSLSSKMRLAIAYVAGGLIGPLLLAGVYVFGVSVALANSPSHGVRPWVVMAGAGALAAFALLYVSADLTSWSLHPFYKRRLCSAFALKRLYERDLTPREHERVEALRCAAPEAPPAVGAAEQGRDVAAGAPDLRGTPIAVERDYDELVRLSDTAVKGRDWPTLLVCAAANISDCGATPPGRRVTSFTFSANTVGGPLVGALPTADLERAFKAEARRGRTGEQIDAGGVVRRSLGLPPRRKRVSDFSLPAAVAMSGAAISPSMGKMTRRPFTFLLALANVRLGVWVPNPRWVAFRLERKKHILVFGRPRPIYLFKEMLGRNSIRDRYLYVTDGGHYENLGLVELLRRGCRKIYCFDASGGEGFEVLGDAIALARSELGVEIGGIRPKPLFPDKESQYAEATAVHVDFRYPTDPEGEMPCRLVYARNVMTEGSPWDVLARHKSDPNFPHNSTIDQLYTDQKFEGYRVLGECAAKAAVAVMEGEAPPDAARAPE